MRQPDLSITWNEVTWIADRSDDFPPSSNSSVSFTPPPSVDSDSNARVAPPSMAAVESYHERIRTTVEEANAYKTIQYPMAKFACSKLWNKFKGEHMGNLGNGSGTGSPFTYFPAVDNVFWRMLTYLMCDNRYEFEMQVNINCSIINSRESNSKYLLAEARERAPIDNAVLSAVLKILHDEEWREMYHGK